MEFQELPEENLLLKIQKNVEITLECPNKNLMNCYLYCLTQRFRNL